MIKLYYNLTTFQYIGKDSGSETWVQGDDDSKSLALYFGSGADVANFVNGLTSTTIYAKECSLNVERPDETTATLAATAIVSGTDIYYKIVVDSWVCEQEGLLSLTAVLKTATTTQAYGLATQAVAAGAAPSVETITTAQYNTLISNYNTLNSLKLNAAVKGYYKASDFALTGTMTTEAYVEAVYAALIDAEGDYALDTIAHILNDCVTLSDLPATGASDVLLILQFEDEAGTAAKRAQLIARGSTASDWLYYAFVNSSVDTGFSGWKRYLNDTDLAGITDGSTIVGSATNDKDGNAIDTTYLKKSGGTMAGAINMGTNKITGLANGTEATDVVNKSQLDLKEDKTTVQTAIDELDNEIGKIKTGVTTVGSAFGDGLGSLIHTTYLKRTGGTMAGNIAMGSNKITGLANGTSPADAVNKSQLDLKEDKANKGATNGYAPLVGGVIPAAYVPNAYDDFAEYATYALLEAEETKTTAVLYIVTADETSGGNTSTYRWTGSTFIKIHDQLSASEVKTLYESNANTNAYTDDEKSHLAALPSTAYSQEDLDGGQLDNRYYTETEIGDGTVPIVKAATHVDTPKVVFSPTAYMQYDSVNKRLKIVITE